MVELLVGHGARIDYQTKVIRGDGSAGARSFCVVHCVRSMGVRVRVGVMYWYVRGCRLGFRIMIITRERHRHTSEQFVSARDTN